MNKRILVMVAIAMLITHVAPHELHAASPQQLHTERQEDIHQKQNKRLQEKTASWAFKGAIIGTAVTVGGLQFGISHTPIRMSNAEALGLIVGSTIFAGTRGTLSELRSQQRRFTPNGQKIALIANMVGYAAAFAPTHGTVATRILPFVKTTSHRILTMSGSAGAGALVGLFASGFEEIAEDAEKQAKKQKAKKIGTTPISQTDPYTTS
jgi:hypothetical protein